METNKTLQPGQVLEEVCGGNWNTMVTDNDHRAIISAIHAYDGQEAEISLEYRRMFAAELMKYVTDHFEHEAQLMRQTEYSQSDMLAHFFDHWKLQEIFRSNFREILREDVEVIVDPLWQQKIKGILQSFHKALLEHIQIYDIPVIQHLRTNQA